jgi:hypothetical protein
VCAEISPSAGVDVPATSLSAVASFAAPVIARETQFAAPLSLGAAGQAVRHAQEWLTFHGLGLKVDGEFGPATQAAVLEFQKRCSLPRTGRVDGPTFDNMIAPLSAVLRPIDGTGVLSQDAPRYAEQHLAQRPREVGGENCGPWVRLYMNGVDGSDFPWCAGFACFVLRQASAGKPLPFVPSVSCDEIGNHAKDRGLFREGGPGFDTSKLRTGSLFLVRRQQGGWHHTGFVVGVASGAVTTIEGNTNDSGSREGFEVCKRVRATTALDFVLLPA